MFIQHDSAENKTVAYLNNNSVLKETALDNVMLNELTIKSFLEGFYLETSLMGNTLQGST